MIFFVFPLQKNHIGHVPFLYTNNNLCPIQIIFAWILTLCEKDAYCLSTQYNLVVQSQILKGKQIQLVKIYLKYKTDASVKKIVVLSLFL